MAESLRDVVIAGAREFNDDPNRTNSLLYREFEPDFEKAHREALKSAEYLRRKYRSKKD